MLKRFKQIRRVLQVMVIDDKWTEYKDDDVQKAASVTEKILNDRNKITPKRAEDLVFVHTTLRLLSRQSSKYKDDETKMWDIGGDRWEHFDGLGTLEVASLSLDEPELEADLLAGDGGGMMKFPLLKNTLKVYIFTIKVRTGSKRRIPRDKEWMHGEGSQPMERQEEQRSYQDSIQNVNRGLEFEESKFEGEELEGDSKNEFDSSSEEADVEIENTVGNGIEVERDVFNRLNYKLSDREWRILNRLFKKLLIIKLLGASKDKDKECEPKYGKWMTVFRKPRANEQGQVNQGKSVSYKNDGPVATLDLHKSDPIPRKVDIQFKKPPNNWVKKS
ncbi:Dimer_Tnp_hAT domain-containing protein [Senna tora]|uniref:Dimer_Tnp_hAT domain-containing protein n=1 Tax=Senna tora TaxID=362788 RepID=A0A835CG09_9FABA|nr:Dimer_Tnp_hAT domain-containing protein [Senna tora]